MKIVIPGGSGQVGTVLARTFHADGNDVVVLSRHPRQGPWRQVEWDGRSMGSWIAELDGADAVINLAGRSVNCRYTVTNRAAIMNSRVDSTRIVGEAIRQASRPPPIWLQASTATIYSHRLDGANDELEGQIGGGTGAPASWQFSIEVAKAWEAACERADVPSTRRVIMRTTMVMSPDRGGIFDTMLALVRRGLGGTAGTGRQYISWIHDVDFANVVRQFLADASWSGVVNVGAPSPVPNGEFMRTLRAAWGIRRGLPASRWMLSLGALAMGTETELVLKSRRVQPRRLLESGFSFRFPTWDIAARDLCVRWRRGG